VSGSYHRFSDSLVSRLFSANTRTSKPCGESWTSEVNAAIAGKTEVGGSIYIVKLTASADVKKIETWVSAKGPKTHIAFSTYLLDRSGSREENSVVAVALCDDEKVYPSKGLLLSIRHPRLGTEEISITQASVNATYTKSLLLGLTPLGEASTTALRKGQFWQVRGSDQYFLLRDAIYYEVSGLTEEMREVFDDKQTERAKDFFTHLILAAAVRFVPKE
jgi:hypothetical protein